MHCMCGAKSLLQTGKFFNCSPVKMNLLHIVPSHLLASFFPLRCCSQSTFLQRNIPRIILSCLQILCCISSDVPCIPNCATQVSHCYIIKEHKTFSSTVVFVKILTYSKFESRYLPLFYFQINLA